MAFNSDIMFSRDLSDAMVLRDAYNCYVLVHHVWTFVLGASVRMVLVLPHIELISYGV